MTNIFFNVHAAIFERGIMEKLFLCLNELYILGTGPG